MSIESDANDNLESACATLNDAPMSLDPSKIWRAMNGAKKLKRYSENLSPLFDSLKRNCRKSTRLTKNFTSTAFQNSAR